MAMPGLMQVSQVAGDLLDRLKSLLPGHRAAFEDIVKRRPVDELTRHPEVSRFRAGVVDVPDSKCSESADRFRFFQTVFFRESIRQQRRRDDLHCDRLAGRRVDADQFAKRTFTHFCLNAVSGKPVAKLLFKLTDLLNLKCGEPDSKRFSGCRSKFPKHLPFEVNLILSRFELPDLNFAVLHDKFQMLARDFRIPRHGPAILRLSTNTHDVPVLKGQATLFTEFFRRGDKFEYQLALRVQSLFSECPSATADTRNDTAHLTDLN